MKGALCAWCTGLIDHDEDSNYCSEVCEKRARGMELVTVERDGKRVQEWVYRPTRQLTLEEVA